MPARRAGAALSSLVAAAAAAEGRDFAPAGTPVGDAARDRARVDAGRLQHAGSHGRARARLADGHDLRAVDEAVLRSLPHVAVGHVVGPGDESGVALVRLAHVEHLDLAGGEEALEFVHRHRLDAFVTAPRLPAGHLEDADRVQCSPCALGLGLVVRVHDDGAIGKHEGGLRREARSRDGDVDGAWSMTARERADGAHVEHDRLTGVRHRLERRLRPHERTAVVLHDPLHVRRARRLRPQREADELVVILDQRVVEAALEADRRRRLRAHRPAAQRAGHVAGIHLDAVAELGEPVQRTEEILGSVVRFDREVGPGRVTDEEGVAGEDEPRLVAATAVAHREGTVLGTVPGRMDSADDDVPELDLRAVGERLVRILRAGGLVNVNCQPVLEGEPAVPGDVVGVVVGLEHRRQPDAAPLRLLEVGLDPVSRIDHHRETGVLVADEVGGAAEVVVDELLEQHPATLAPETAISLEVTAAYEEKRSLEAGIAKSWRRTRDVRDTRPADCSASALLRHRRASRSFAASRARWSRCSRVWNRTESKLYPFILPPPRSCCSYRQDGGRARILPSIEGVDACYLRAYSSAACGWNSKPTNRSSPRISALWPGSITYASPGPISTSVPSS